jgi:hypothetical protein
MTATAEPAKSGRTRTRKVVPPQRADAPRRRDVPGMPGWKYLPGQGVWDDRGRLVLTWCPTVDRHLAGYNGRGEITHLRVTVRVGQGALLTVTMADLIKGEVWERLPGAAGAGTRTNREALHCLVRDQADRLALTPTMPRWEGGHLVMPPVDVLPRGYAQVAGDASDWRVLLREVARSPRMALIMGLALAGLYVRPLARQSYMVHMPGASSEGKTSTMTAAAAVVGNPLPGEGVIGKWAVTAQGPGAWLRTLACLTGYRDELSACSLTGKALENLVFSALEGAERDRSGRDGSYIDSPGSWHGALISTGNAGIVGQIENEGIVARVIEITGPLAVDGDHADRVVELARVAYGHGLAGLIERGPTPERFAKAAKEHFALVGGPTGGVLRRLAEHLSMGLAGVALLAELAECPEFEVGALDAARAILAELEAELEQRGARPSDRLMAALAASMTSQPAAWPTRQHYARALRGEAIMPAKVFGWSLAGDDIDGDVAVIDRELKTAIAGADVDAGIALRELHRRGLLRRWQRGAHLPQRIDVGGIKRRAYVITGLFTDGDEEPEKKPPVPTQEALVPTAVPTKVPTRGEPPEQQSSHSSHFSEADVVMRVREAGSGGHGVCAVCRAPGVWCGLGRGWPTPVPCVRCGQPTDLSSACGAMRCPECLPPETPSKPAVRVVETSGAGRGTSGDPRPAPAVHGRSEAGSASRELDDWRRAVRKAAEYRREPEPVDVDMIAALNLWRDVTGGLRWVEWAGATGIAAWYAIHDRRSHSSRTPIVERIDSPVLTRMVAGVRLHHDFVVPGREVTVGGAAGGPVIAQTDVNFQYGAAASSAVLGDGEPVHYARPPRGGIGGLLTRAGYVVTADRVVTGHPALGTIPGGSVLTMPQVKYLVKDRALDVPVAEMALWTPETSGPRLRSWSLRFGKAREALLGREDLPAVYAGWMVKAVVTTVLGGLLRSADRNPSEMMRRDWSDQVMTTAAVNAWRALDKVEKARQEPGDAGDASAVRPLLVGMRRDSAWWLCGAEPLAPNGLDLSGKGGKWKLDRWAVIDGPMVEAYRAGSAERFNEMLKNADAARRAGA